MDAKDMQRAAACTAAMLHGMMDNYPYVRPVEEVWKISHGRPEGLASMYHTLAKYGTMSAIATEHIWKESKAESFPGEKLYVVDEAFGRWLHSHWVMSMYVSDAYAQQKLGGLLWSYFNGADVKYHHAILIELERQTGYKP